MLRRKLYSATISIVVIVILSVITFRAAEIIVAASQPNSRTHLVPLQEWDFSTGNFDGPSQVTIIDLLHKSPP